MPKFTRLAVLVLLALLACPMVSARCDPNAQAVKAVIEPVTRSMAVGETDTATLSIRHLVIFNDVFILNVEFTLETESGSSIQSIFKDQGFPLEGSDSWNKTVSYTVPDVPEGPYRLALRFECRDNILNPGHDYEETATLFVEPAAASEGKGAPSTPVSLLALAVMVLALMRRGNND